MLTNQWHVGWKRVSSKIHGVLLRYPYSLILNNHSTICRYCLILRGHKQKRPTDAILPLAHRHNYLYFPMLSLNIPPWGKESGRNKKRKNSLSRSVNHSHNKTSVQWEKKRKIFVVLKRADKNRLWKRLVGKQDIWTALQDLNWHWREAGCVCVCVFLSVTHALSLRASSPAAAIFL